MTEDGQELLAKSFGTGAVAAPGSGATITLWASNANNGSVYTTTSLYKRLIVNIYSSAASAASGLTFEESNDGGTNWRTVVSYTIAATTYTKNYVSVSAPYVRVRYVNSASVLTTWEMSVLGDQTERATQ